MGIILEFPKQQQPIAFVPDIVSYGICGPTLQLDQTILAAARAAGKTPIIIPLLTLEGTVDIHTLAYLIIHFEQVEISPTMRERITASDQKKARKLISCRKNRLDMFQPRVMVAADFKDGLLRLSQRFVTALRQGSRVIPVISGGAEHLANEMQLVQAAGLLAPGSNTHYDPKHYGVMVDDNQFYDPARDRLVQSMVQLATTENIPYFGICSGMQGLALFHQGGSRLHQNLADLGRTAHHLPGAALKLYDFRAGQAATFMPLKFSVPMKTERFQAAHKVRFAADGFIARLLRAPTGQAPVISVNSLHQQAIDELSLNPNLSIEGEAEDDTIEAIHNRAHIFMVGVQFHPEAAYMPGLNVPQQEKKLYRRLFWAFGEAARGSSWQELLQPATRSGGWRNRGMPRAYMTPVGSIRPTPAFVTNFFIGKWSPH